MVLTELEKRIEDINGNFKKKIKTRADEYNHWKIL